jgi:hypothetical protein
MAYTKGVVVNRVYDFVVENWFNNEFMSITVLPQIVTDEYEQLRV